MEKARSRGEIVEDVYYSIANPRDFYNCFYFDYIFVNSKGDLAEPPFAGGYVGITIDKSTGGLKNITTADLGGLSLRERKINELLKALTEFRENKGSLSFIKEKFNLSSAELLEFSKKIKEQELSRSSIMALFGSKINGS